MTGPKTAGGQTAPAKKKATAAKSAAKSGQKAICLALQGGGAHGAFTWGVLDALLEDGRIRIDAISGTSAGAVNAVALIDGWMDGGADGARAQLERFWRSISVDGGWTGSQRAVLDRLMGSFRPDWSFTGAWIDAMAQFASPYSVNPMNLNPLKDVLEREIDFNRVRSCSEIGLFVPATNVRTGKIKVFERSEITADHIMASACLPLLFQAVEIGDEAYWDGGYMGNPALYPLFYNADSRDVVLVQINPVERRELPRTVREIEGRLNEITFNATLLRELRAVEFVTRLLDQGLLPADRYKRVLMHRIDADVSLKSFGAATKMDAGWTFLTHLRDAGRETAQLWLKRHYDDLGTRDSFDLKTELA